MGMFTGVTKGDIIQATLPSIVALVLGAGAVFATIQVLGQRLDTVETNVRDLQGAMQIHRQLNGHPVMVERVENLKSQLTTHTH